MSFKLFLDDMRNPMDCLSYMAPRTSKLSLYEETWVIVRSYQEFVDTITRAYRKTGMPDIISFDHDLSQEHYAPVGVWDQREKYSDWEAKQNFREKNGKDAASWLGDFCVNHEEQIPEFIVHSMNPYGSENIQSILDQYGLVTRNF